jgi:Mg2+ and Co2+ transporter CorA
VLRRILGPQREVVRSLSQALSPLFDDPIRRAFADVYDHSFRLVETLDSARALLGAVMDTYRGAVAERTNEVMKVLTVFSAILLPLGLIAGLWGMNFAEIPGSAWRWGFVALLGAMAAFAVGLWVYFVRRGFVGGPKLRDLPKAVGLGLVQIGTAPLRIVTGKLSNALGSGGDEHPGTNREGPDAPGPL